MIFEANVPDYMNELNTLEFSKIYSESNFF